MPESASVPRSYHNPARQASDTAKAAISNGGRRQGKTIPQLVHAIAARAPASCSTSGGAAACPELNLFCFRLRRSSRKVSSRSMASKTGPRICSGKKKKVGCLHIQLPYSPCARGRSYSLGYTVLLSGVCAGVSRYAMKKEAKRYAASVQSVVQANPRPSVHFHPTWRGARSGLCTCKAQKPPQSCGTSINRGETIGTTLEGWRFLWVVATCFAAAHLSDNCLIIVTDSRLQGGQKTSKPFWGLASQQKSYKSR